MSCDQIVARHPRRAPQAFLAVDALCRVVRNVGGQVNLFYYWRQIFLLKKEEKKRIS
jgi:hypothetical protein